MKINKILQMVLACTAVFVASSCDGIFRDAPINKVSEKDVWSNAMMLDEYTNAWYRNMNNGFSTYVPSISLVKSASRYYMPWFGDQITVGKSDWFNAGYGDLLKGNSQEITSWARYNWNIYMTQVQSINTLLENQAAIPNGQQKTRTLAEAHFFRAYYYYIMWRMFGGVMIIDHTFDPLVYAEKFPRASYQQMVDFITSEARQAADVLPTTYDSADKGRITKGAALMLIAKTYLWAAGKPFQNKGADKTYLGFADDRTQDMLSSAKKAYEDIMALGVYKLIPIASTTQDGIRDEYRKIFLTKNSEESILEVQHSDDGDYANKFGHTLDRDAVPPSFTGTTAAYTPTQNHVDEYGMRQGYIYDEAHPYEGRDYRFYANIVYDGCTFRGRTMDIHYTDGKAGAELTPYGTSTSAATTRTGYYMGKFVDESQTIDNNDTYASKQDYIIWRYAEALLDYAEVCYLLGDQSTALEYVNNIRTRVHMPALSSLSWEQLVNERRVEMAFEETTYWDLLRWGVAVERMSGESNPLKAMRVDVNNGKTQYTVSNLNRFPKRVRLFTAKQYYLPIPWSEIKYHGVEQNPEWTEQ